MNKSQTEIATFVKEYNEKIQKVQQNFEKINNQFEFCKYDILIRIDTLRSLIKKIYSKDLFNKLRQTNHDHESSNYEKCLKRVKKRIQLVYRYLFRPYIINDNNNRKNYVYDIFIPQFEYGNNVDAKKLRNVLKEYSLTNNSRGLEIICDPNEETNGFIGCRKHFREKYMQCIMKTNVFIVFLTKDLMQSFRSNLLIKILEEAIKTQKICVIIMIDVELNTISPIFDYAKTNGNIFKYHFSKRSEFDKICQILVPFIYFLATTDRYDLNDLSYIGHICYNEEDYSKSAILPNLKVLEEKLEKENYDFQTIGDMLKKFMNESNIPLEEFDFIEFTTKLNEFKKKLENFNTIETCDEFLELKKSFYANKKRKASHADLQMFCSVHKSELNDFINLLSNSNVDINAGYRGFSLFLWAIFNDKVEMVEYMLTHFEVNFDITDKFERNCFELAVIYCQGGEIIQFLSKYQHKNKCTYPIVSYFFNEKSDITSIEVNFKDGFGSTILHYVAARNKTDLLDLLDFTNVDFKAKDKENLTCFDRAATNGHLDMLIKLLKKFNIQLDYSNEESKEILKSIVISALWRCRESIIKWWFENIKFIPGNFVDENCLMSNVISSDPDLYKNIIEHLLDNGGNINHRNDKGNTIIVNYLMSLYPLSKAQINVLLDKGFKLNTLNEKGQTAVHLGAIYGSLELIEIAHEAHGMSITEPDLDGKTPLMLASIRGCIHIVKYLISNINRDELDDHLQKVDNQNKNACNLALQNGCDEIVLYLLSKGLNPNGIENIFKLPIGCKENYCMLKSLDLSTIKSVGLCNFPSDIRMNDFETTPLHLFAIVGRNDAIIRLYKNGFDMKCVDKYENTALYYAIKYNQIETVFLLISLGVVELNSRNLNGKILCENVKKDSSIVEIKPGSIVSKVLKEVNILSETVKFGELNNQFLNSIKDKIRQFIENSHQGNGLNELSTYKKFLKELKQINYFPNIIKWIKEHKSKYPDKDKILYDTLTENQFWARSCKFLKYYFEREKLQLLDDDRFKVVDDLLNFILTHIDEREFRKTVEISEFVELFFQINFNRENTQVSEKMKITYAYARLILFSIIINKNLNMLIKNKCINWIPNVFGPFISSTSKECVIKTTNQHKFINLCVVIDSLRDVAQIKLIQKSFKEQLRMDKSCLLLLKGHINEKIALSQFILDLCHQRRFKMGLRDNFLLVATLNCICEYSENVSLRQLSKRILEEINYIDPWRVLGTTKDTLPVQESTFKDKTSN